MTVTNKQLAYLKEIGIELWQRKSIALNNNTQTKTTEKITTDNIEDVIDVSLSEISHYQLFKDVLLCLNLSIKDIKEMEKKLDFGLFKWVFTNNPTLVFSEKTLSTPHLEYFINNAKLKKDLWLILSQQGLYSVT